jgi:hypothetical protein
MSVIIIHKYVWFGNWGIIKNGDETKNKKIYKFVYKNIVTKLIYVGYEEHTLQVSEKKILRKILGRDYARF